MEKVFLDKIIESLSDNLNNVNGFRELSNFVKSKPYLIFKNFLYQIPEIRDIAHYHDHNFSNIMTHGGNIGGLEELIDTGEMSRDDFHNSFPILPSIDFYKNSIGFIFDTILGKQSDRLLYVSDIKKYGISARKEVEVLFAQQLEKQGVKSINPNMYFAGVNALKNAIEASEKLGLEHNASVDYKIYKDKVEMIIRDSAGGIPYDVLGSMFGEYSTKPNSTNKGVALAGLLGMIKRSGGNMEVLTTTNGSDVYQFNPLGNRGIVKLDSSRAYGLSNGISTEFRFELPVYNRKTSVGSVARPFKDISIEYVA